MKREAMTHMPFGAGPHVCLGAKFALAQMKMALVSILLHYTFVLSPKTEVKSPAASIWNLPSHQMCMDRAAFLSGACTDQRKYCYFGMYTSYCKATSRYLCVC